MCTEVHIQLPRVDKTLSALLTRVRFFSCVDALVLLEAIKPAEGLTTICAQIHLLSLLEAAVILEALDCAKALAALAAAVRLFNRQNTPFLETQIFYTHFWVVTADVFVKISLISEGEGAVCAGKDVGINQGRALAVGFAA